MRYIRIYGDAAYCGIAFEEYLETDMTDEQLDDYVSDAVMENAESYDYLVFYGTSMEEYIEENEISIEEAEQMIDDYYADASGSWEEITKEEYEDAH